MQGYHWGVGNGFEVRFILVIVLKYPSSTKIWLGFVIYYWGRIDLVDCIIVIPRSLGREHVIITFFDRI